MNSVHLLTQEKYRVKNQVEKLSQVHKHPTGQAGHPGTPRCVHSGRIVALGPAVSWPGPAVSQRQAAVLQRSPARSWAPAPAACSQRLPRAPRPLTPARPFAPARPARARAQSPARPPAPSTCLSPALLPPCPPQHPRLRASWPYRRPCLASCHNTTLLYCDTSSSPALQPIAIQYTVLRYSSPAAPNPYVTIHLGFTIQLFPNLLQYNPSLQYNTSSPCNTVGQ